MAATDSPRPCILALEDGSFFRGFSFGGRSTRTGEVVFNTAMSGYQEILTDPSYCGQIVVMTSPHIGNYGTNESDAESRGLFASGLVVREASRVSSNHRSTKSLADLLFRHEVVGICGVDTRAITRHIRTAGAMMGAISTEVLDPAECVTLARNAPPMEGCDLVRRVTPPDGYSWSEGLDPAHHYDPPGSERRSAGAAKRFRVVAIDCGIKRNILRRLVSCGCEVEVVPATTPAAAILEREPDGLFVSNGPGDPAAVGYVVDVLREVSPKLPTFGICLGHQLLALSLGAETYKLPFGHHGGNHPVKNLRTGRVEITAQNHGFAVREESLSAAGAEVTHVNLNDSTIEGFVHRDRPLLAIQYHPEAGPGPRDASYLFDLFVRMMATGAPLCDFMTQSANAQTGSQR